MLGIKDLAFPSMANSQYSKTSPAELSTNQANKMVRIFAKIGKLAIPGTCMLQILHLYLSKVGLERFRIFTVRLDFDSHTLDSIFFE